MVEAQVSRQWRPAAQRNLRNQWSKLSSLRQQWSSSSSAARSHATCLVNAYLSRIYMPSMELGVFEQHALYSKQSSLKLAKQQQFHRSNLLSSYGDMVFTLKGQARLLLSGFLVLQIIGVTLETVVVYRFLHFGQSLVLKHADEVVRMLVLELNLKRLIVVELVSISCDLVNNNNELYPGEFHDLSVCKLFCGDKPISQCNPNPKQDTCQVYLTTWLAEVNVDAHRVDEIFAATGEEMHVNL